MNPLSLGVMAELVGGKLVAGNADRCANHISTDSRSIKPGSLFVALKGDRFDGHDFIQAAQQAGAIGALVEKVQTCDPSFGLIQVEDALKGLQQLAQNYRRSLKNIRVVALTGSNGKSTTKEMITSILAQKFSVHKTQGNFNNHIGVPLTLLGFNAEHQWGVVEIGMNHEGETAPLVAMAEPTVGVITNVGYGHIEAFEDQDGIAAEKSQLVRALPADGFAVLNADDHRVRAMQYVTKARSVLAGHAAEAAYRYDEVEVFEDHIQFNLHTPQGSATIQLQTPAPHFVQNAVIASAVGEEAGVPLDQIAQGLAAFSVPSSRCNLKRHEQGWLIDDTYNANPDSMIAGFEMLRNLSGTGRQVALLGAMGELGTWSERLHRKVGQTAVEKGVQLLFALGADSKFIIEAARQAGLSEDQAQWFENHQTLLEAYEAISKSDDKILVKGSRSQKMEQVVRPLGESTCCITSIS